MPKKKHDAGTTRSTCTLSPFLPRAGPNRADPNRNSTFHKKEKEKDQKDHVHCGSEQPGIQKRKIILPFDRRCPKPKNLLPLPRSRGSQIPSHPAVAFSFFSLCVSVCLSLSVGGKEKKKKFLSPVFFCFPFFCELRLSDCCGNDRPPKQGSQKLLLICYSNKKKKKEKNKVV